VFRVPEIIFTFMKTKRAPKPTVKTADRTLDLFELFAREQRPLNLSQIAQLLAIPVSSAHGLIKTLQARGYLFELSRREGYYPSRRLPSLAEAIAAATPVGALVSPILGALRDESKESVVLVKRQGDRVQYVEVFETDESVRFSPVAGETKPIHTTASGKAILSTLAPDALEASLARLDLTPVTELSVTTARELRDHVEKGRRRGYWVVAGENIRDLMALAAPVRIGGEVFAVVVGGPPPRIRAAIAEHAQRLLRACAEVERVAGGPRQDLTAPQGGRR
jgi:DNA-binding IclR family transcriptional regulator